jgi:phosphinothricin acetyltransferase
MVSGPDERISQMFRAVANPVRLRMVSLLAERHEMSAQQFAGELQISKSSLFEHLAQLRDSGWIAASGESNPTHRYYCLNPEAIHFVQAVVGGWASTGETHVAAQQSGISVRTATTADAEAIAVIYNQGIEDRVATLETVPRDAAERAAWIEAKGVRYPVLIAIDGEGHVLGWASLNQFNPRPAYDHVVDISVYVERGQRGKGIGDTLIKALETRARELGYHKLVLAAFPTNAPGMRLYQRNGFSTVGIYHEQGRLDDRWVDTIVMEKLLA